MAGFNFRESALQQTQLSELMENRNKLDTEDIIKIYPEGVTVTEFDMITIDDKQFPVLCIKEDPGVFFFGGAILAKICMGWVEAGGVSVKETSEALKQSGGVKMKLESKKTKGGKSLTGVTIL